MSAVRTNCQCPPNASIRCSPADQTSDARGKRLCCPYDEEGMALYYGVANASTAGRRAAMRKRLQGALEDIAQRAADTRKGV